MKAMLRAMACAALLCAPLVSCTSEKAPADTSSTKYLFEEVFNPCREMPPAFLANNHLDSKPEFGDNMVDGYVYWGCFYRGQDYDLGILVTNSPLSQVSRLEPHTLQSVQIAGRAARIQSLPLEKRFCLLYIEMTGGTLTLDLAPRSAIEACPTVTTLAEELVPLLPPGV
ncbi:DUF3558 family protein [Nocardia sp. CS682]|uniref:DUF3558 family protein n=1 Tax=Nocardia sp. CS682 TaxID=1047172 RepID=UPI0010752339|nr:DUF3558 family protein [Nocardia sp. CS682]QBS39871.1 hypothetical protein DMB37_06710 [Nocardia sp. CS682]